MQTYVPARFWRWLALLMITLNAMHGLLLQRLHPSLPSIAEVSLRNKSLLTFRRRCVRNLRGDLRSNCSFLRLYSFAFAAKRARVSAPRPWARGLRLPRYREGGKLYPRTPRPKLSVIIIGGMFALAAQLFGLAKKRLGGGIGGAPLYSPFSLFFGWISVATLANVASWLKSMGWAGGAWGESAWTVVMITTALCLGILVSGRFRDSVYPLVILWALVAIWEHQRNTGSFVEYFALASAMLLTPWTLINAGWIRSHTLIFRSRINPTSPTS